MLVITIWHSGTCRNASSKIDRQQKCFDLWQCSGCRTPSKSKKRMGTVQFQKQISNRDETSIELIEPMRLVGRGLFSLIERKSGGCPPESVSHPKPTLVGRCSNCARHAAWCRKTCSWRPVAGTSVVSSRGTRTIEVLAEQMQIHPLTLVAAAYCPELDATSVSELLKVVKADFKSIVSD